MEILISTNMYQACDFAKVLELTDAFSQERVGVEVFSMFHDPVFADVLRASEEKLSTLPISFHGPYAQTEHSRPKGTPAYERSMGFYREMLPFAKRLHSSYVVFHHNNCKVLDVDREAMLQTADENLRELTPKADLVLEYAPDVAADQAGILKDVKTLCQFRETV